MQSRCFKATERGAEQRYGPSKGEGPDAIVAIWSEGQVSQGDDLPLDPKDVSANFQSRIECSSPVHGILGGLTEREGSGLAGVARILANPLRNWAESSTYVGERSQELWDRTKAINVRD